MVNLDNIIPPKEWFSQENETLDVLRQLASELNSKYPKVKAKLVSSAVQSTGEYTVKFVLRCNVDLFSVSLNCFKLFPVLIFYDLDNVVKNEYCYSIEECVSVFKDIFHSHACRRVVSTLMMLDSD